MIMAASKVPQDKPFNMAILYLSGIQDLISWYDAAMVEDDLSKAYECNEGIYGKIYFKLNKKEDEIIVDMMNKIKPLFRSNGNTPAAKQAYYQNLSEAKKKIRIVHKTLISYLAKYQLLMPNIDYKGGIDRIKHRYDLNG